MDAGPADGEAAVREAKRIDLGIDAAGLREALRREPPITLEEAESRLRRQGIMQRLRGLRFRLGEIVRSARMRTRLEWQRRVRGWTDRDWWELDAHLCHHVGRLMLESAERGRSYPPSHTLDSWQSELRAQGQALISYDGFDADRVAQARTALRWVTANLTRLWD